VVSAHPGNVIVYSRCSFEIIDPTRQWSTRYYHVDRISVPTGSMVDQNSPISGYASIESAATCTGGFSDEPHLHFSLYQVDPGTGDLHDIDLNGVVMSRYTYNSLASQAYDSDCNRNWFEQNGRRYCPFDRPGIQNNTAAILAKYPQETHPNNQEIMRILDLILID